MRKRWLLREAALAPWVSAHSRGGLEQDSECDVDAAPDTCGLHLSRYWELVAIEGTTAAMAQLP